MPRPYRDAALIERAEILAVREGLTLAQIAEQVSEVTPRTIQDWSIKYQWVTKREKYLHRRAAVNDLVETIRQRLANVALRALDLLESDDFDPSTAHAIGQLSNQVCRMLAAIKPASAVALRELDRAEAESNSMTAEERMTKVMEFLQGAGFGK